MTKVFVAKHPAEAHLIRGLLESGGIQAIVRGESLFGARGEAPVTFDTLPSVWVLDDQQTAAALDILRDHEGRAEAASAQASWRCPRCGTDIEPQFTACWQCGTERPDASPVH